MCIILWNPLNRSLFEVITLWTGGMLFGVLLPFLFRFRFCCCVLGIGVVGEYYRKKMTPEAPEHTTLRTPGASRLHAPQMARALEEAKRTHCPSHRQSPCHAGKSGT